MQTLSLVWGILAFIGMMVGFFPCLGSLNWLNIPFSAVGLLISIVAATGARGPAKGGSIAGIVLCAVAIALGLMRLVAGGGIL